MQRNLVGVLVLLLVSAATTPWDGLAGQQPQQSQGKMFEYGKPLAPNQDIYYLDEPREEWIPDEFLSNPDPVVDPKTLKGYHLPPFLHKVKVLNPEVKAGDTVRFEAMVEDVVGVNPWPIGFQGPQGRRTSFTVRMRPSSDNPFLHEGSFRIHEWTEPGLYFMYTLGVIANELGHSKAYFQDYHPGLKDVYFTVLPNPKADVMPPVLEEVRIGEKDRASDEVPSFDISQAIPIYVRATDNISGVASIKVRLINSLERYSELTLLPTFEEEDWYVGYVNIPKHYVGGPYRVMSMWIGDRAGQQVFMFGNTHPLLKTARFNVIQDPAQADTVPPRLITVTVDRKQAALGSQIQVTAVAVDDLSGVGTLVIDFAAMPSYIDKRRVHMNAVARPEIIQKSGFNIDANTYVGSFRTHVMDEPGEWHVVRVMARDNADNLLDMREYEYPLLANVKIDFTGGVNPAAGEGRMTQTSVGAAGAATQSAAPGRVRRVDMIPPHPPRGACLNCHVP